MLGYSRRPFRHALYVAAALLSQSHSQRAHASRVALAVKDAPSVTALLGRMGNAMILVSRLVG